MAGKQGRMWAAWAACVFLLAPAGVSAGPYLGEWSWCWHPARDCPRGEYCLLHYWAPEIYKLRAYVHPSDVNQFPPGPCPAVAPVVETVKYPCRTIPAAPTAPYTDPAAYFGRAVVPQ